MLQRVDGSTRITATSPARPTRTHASAAGNNNDARYSILTEGMEEDKEREIIDTIFVHLRE